MLSAGLRPFCRSWKAVPASVPAARAAVLAFLDEAELGSLPRGDVQLAITEAVTNVVTHAYLDGEPGQVRVEIDEDGGAARIVVSDDGRGMQPRTDSPGLGLGLSLMATVTDRFDARADPGSGTRVCMWFREQPAAAAAG
jgi:serine/threonine-protein kinase RsbW/stage II sporulation protein AB (anti-sigma F factor)